MSAIHAPYSFIPLSRDVFSPSWGAEVSHDIPFQDGYCGTLDIRLTAETPILVGGEQSKAANENTVSTFHQLPDGRYAIPGTSLKGMLRSVLEIVSFGKMQRVTDQQLSMRDLAPGSPYAQIVNGKQRSGWLRLENGQWKLYPCDHIQVYQSDLISVDSRFREVLKLGRASQRFKAQKDAGLGSVSYQTLFGVSFVADTETVTPPKGNPITKKIARRVQKGTDGYVVYTGQVDKKKREFIFTPPGQNALIVAGEVLTRFGNAHRASPQNPETDYDWYMAQKWMLTDHGIPVFYVAKKDGSPEHIGLAFMFRLACASTVHDSVRRVQGQFDDSLKLDLSECLFGRVEPTGKGNLKSRISIEDAIAEGTPRPVALENTVLSSPKVSYYPAYLQQKSRNEGLLDGNTYSTYASTEARVSGWKRYPVGKFQRDQLGHFTRNGSPVSDKVQIKLNPLPERTVFLTRLYLHNLKKEELGALVWVLTWGGDVNKRHSIGLGKPFGMGQLKLEVIESRLRPNDARTEVPDLSGLMAAFSQSVMKGLNKHAHMPLPSLPEVQQLLHMAEPSYGASQNLTYMPLAGFRDSKGGRNSSMQVMSPYLSRVQMDKSLAPFAEQSKALEAQFKAEKEAELERLEAAKASAAEAERLAKEEALAGLCDEMREARLLLDDYVALSKDAQSQKTNEVGALVAKATSNAWPLDVREFIAITLKSTHFCDSSKKGKERQAKVKAMLEVKG